MGIVVAAAHDVPMIWFLLVAAMAVVAGLVFAVSVESSLTGEPARPARRPVRLRGERL